MSKAYAVTEKEVDSAPVTKGVYFDKDEAAAAVGKAQEAYKTRLAMMGYSKDLMKLDQNGLAIDCGSHFCEWNINEIEVEIPLTGLQTCQVNEIASLVHDNLGTYEDYADSLSEEERKYLKATLKATYNIDVDEEVG